ncbi:hypothetical protein ASZ90_015615 [hydrocarbon metagenome]|uniref:Uncharacterized protein n=1 Tax=hydrocarbon metagenome TaxID=938273 RepID=A0A0W8F1J2_9ZZZZ
MSRSTAYIPGTPSHQYLFRGYTPTVFRAGPLFERVSRYADAVEARRDSSDHLSGNRVSVHILLTQGFLVAILV